MERARKQHSRPADPSRHSRPKAPGSARSRRVGPSNSQRLEPAAAKPSAVTSRGGRVAAGGGRASSADLDRGRARPASAKR